MVEQTTLWYYFKTLSPFFFFRDVCQGATVFHEMPAAKDTVSLHLKMSLPADIRKLLQKMPAAIEVL